MPKIPVLTAKELCNHLARYGCVIVSVRGSHHKIHNPKTGKISIVSVHAGKDVGKGAFFSILSQLGIDIDEFIAML